MGVDTRYTQPEVSMPTGSQRLVCLRSWELRRGYSWDYTNWAVHTPGMSLTLVWTLLNLHGDGCGHTTFCVDTSVLHSWSHTDWGVDIPVVILMWVIRLLG